jgi:hypothetical protein
MWSSNAAYPLQEGRPFEANSPALPWSASQPFRIAHSSMIPALPLLRT